MKKGILITLPTSDDVTEYLSAFSKEIIENSKDKQIPIKQIKGKDVTKESVGPIIKNLDYQMLIFNGHGSPNEIRGHKNRELICAGKNDFLLIDRITYARSCWAVMKLGEICMKHSKKGCFIGYKIPFMFLINKNWVANPLKDNIAKVFFDTSNLIPIGLIKGHTAKESNENSKKSMLKAINKALKKKDKDSQIIAETLWNNYIGQEIVGNSDERLI